VDKKEDPRLIAEAKRHEAERRKVAEQRQQLIVGGAWSAYIEANKADWGARHLKDHLEVSHAGGEKKKKHGGKGLTRPGPLAALMPLKLSELTSDCIEVWLRREAAKRATSAAKAFRLLRSFIRWAADHDDFKDLVAADAYRSQRVRKAMPAAHTKEGDCLTKSQLAAWLSAVRGLSNPIIAAYLQALLLTGARREELATLEWKNVDLKWNKLTIRDKVEGSRTIPLTPYVALLLRALPRRNRWVFSSETGKTRRMVEPRAAHMAALKIAEIPHVTLHGLRRSFRTFAGPANLPTGVAAQLMGHKPSAIAEKHYERREFDDLREWHQKFEAWILEKAGIATATNDKSRFGVVASDGTVQPAA
jgi:integrase